MAILKTKNGNIVISNEEAYLSYLNSEILRLNDKLKKEGLTSKEENKLREYMDLYDQLVDWLDDTYGADEKPKAKS